MPKSNFAHALNDGEVCIHYSYDWDDPRLIEITVVEYQGVNIIQLLHPEDYEYLLSVSAEKAPEAKAEEKACAAEAEWERRRDEELFNA